MELLIQLIGFLGLACVIISFQKDRRSFTLIAQMLGALFFVIHFSLLQAYTGAIMNAISAARAYSFNRGNNIYTMYFFILLFWIGGILTWQRYIDILPIISMTLECFALWSKNTKTIRWLFLSARPTWIVYDLLVGSYAGLATEAIIISSVALAIFRFDKSKR